MTDVIRAAFRFPRLGLRAIQENHGAREAAEDPLADKPVAIDDPIVFESQDIVGERAGVAETVRHVYIEGAEEVPASDDRIVQPDVQSLHDATAFKEPEVAPSSDPVEEIDSAPDTAFGRSGGLPPPTIGHSPTLAEVLRLYRETGDWGR